MRMPELRALARERRLRGYSQLRKAELIEFIQNNQWNANPPLQSWEPQRATNRPPLLPPQTQTWDPRGSQALWAHGNLRPPCNLN